jgi:hypothetical protein
MGVCKRIQAPPLLHQPGAGFPPAPEDHTAPAAGFLSHTVVLSLKRTAAMCRRSLKSCHRVPSRCSLPHLKDTGPDAVELTLKVRVAQSLRSCVRPEAALTAFRSTSLVEAVFHFEFDCVVWVVTAAFAALPVLRTKAPVDH